MAMRRKLFPKISIVIPSLNAERTIERTLLSIARQRYPNLQVICADGGSFDGTLAIIERYRRIVSHVISKKDKNPADALNKGFRLADGEIFCYLNADDAFAPDALRAAAKIFITEPKVDVVTGGCRRVFEDGSEFIACVPPTFLQNLSMRLEIDQPSTFWRRSAHRRLGKFDDSYFLTFDWDWWNRLYTSGAQFIAVPRVLSVYYFSEANLTSRGGQRVVDEMYRITKTYGPFHGRIADVYRFLYRYFDLKGYYDPLFRDLPFAKRMVFGSTLWCLRLIFGRRAIDCYNWSWASKQVRGLIWYK